MLKDRTLDFGNVDKVVQGTGTREKQKVEKGDRHADHGT